MSGDPAVVDRFTLSLQAFSSRAVRADGGTTPGRGRHRILRELRGELARHPAVRSVAGEPPQEYREIQASVDPREFGRSSQTASLRVTWLLTLSPGPDASDRTSDTWLRTPIHAYYTLHYSEESGFDCGFHCEPNPHVDRLEHVQERESPDAEYEYETAHFESQSPVDLCWDILGRIEQRA